MITIHKSGKISIPQEDGFIGYAGDNLNKTLEFIVEDQTDKTFYYRAYLEFDDDTVNYFILSRKFVDGNTILVWQVTEDQLYKDGIVYLQIKAFSTEGEVFHTEKVPIFVGASIEFCNYLAERPNSEFIQQEEQLNNLLFDVEKAKEFLPYIGENGNWYVYDYEVKAYYDTGKTALGSAEKYPLTTEVSSESTDENASSAKSVYTYGKQILSDSKEYFSTNAGELEYLNTEDKSTLVNAINELENKKISNITASVSNDNLANQSVTSEKIADSAVTENKIANETVTNNKLAKNSVTTDKIKIGSVTSSKLASDAVNENVLNADLKTKINSKLDKPSADGSAGQVLMTSGGENALVFWGTVSGGSGSTGTSNYLELVNKPSINNIQLSGNVTTDELGIKNGEDGVGIKSIEQTLISEIDNGKNVLTFTLTDGTKSTFTILNGSKGADGKSITTTLVQESLDDGGENIVNFSDGKTLTVKNGSKGSTGEKGDKGDKGDTPIKGVDYFTEEDLAKLKAELSQIETPMYVNSVEECTDTSKLYVLPDGYIYAYTTKTTTHIPVNQIKHSISTDGNSYNGEIGYITGYTISGSDGSDYASSGMEVTGYISCKNGDYIRSNGMTLASSAGYRRLAFYDANFECLIVLSTGSTTKPLDDYLDGENLSFNISDIELLTEEQKEKIAYIRASCNDIGPNSIITVNESTETTTETVTDWYNTNLAFVPADYEDRIIALENNRYSKSRHDGKVCVCFGDSIVANMAEPNDYPSVLADETGMTVYNVGFGGCRMSASMSTVYNAYSMVKLADAITTGDWTEQENGLSSVNISHYAPHIETLKSIDWNKVDFITIGYGTNDIANFVDVDNTEKPLDTTTVLGGLRYSLNTILTVYPHIKILILTPIYRYFNDEGVDSNEKEWYEQRTFTTWTDGILDVAKEYGIPAVDMYRTLGFNKLTRNYYFPSNDGTHPNEIGLKVIGGKIAGKLLSEY